MDCKGKEWQACAGKGTKQEKGRTYQMRKAVWRLQDCASFTSHFPFVSVVKIAAYIIKEFAKALYDLSG